MSNLEKEIDDQPDSKATIDSSTKSAFRPELATVKDDTVKQIKRALNPRAISKEHDPAGRKVTAAKIIQARNKKKHAPPVLTEAERMASEKRMEAITPRLTELICAKLGYTSSQQKFTESMESELDTLLKESGELKMRLEGAPTEVDELPDPKEMLEAYYEKMATMPLTNAEKRELLRPEIIAELSTEEYIALWRRLNPHFLAHVTRQGFRDHNVMSNHSAGLCEFHNGFVGILEDRKSLRPPIAVRDGLMTRDEATIRAFLEEQSILEAESAEAALERLDTCLHHTTADAPRYPDKTSVHFAKQTVAHDVYGGETENEIFYVFPSDVIASQYHYSFSGRANNFTERQNDNRYNDVFVWPSTVDDPGILLDTGVVFLPENTAVDPETGSKYASEVKMVDGEQVRVMIEDEKLVSAFKEWAENLTVDSPVIRTYLEHGKSGENRNALSEKYVLCLEGFSKEIENLGFCREAALAITKSLLSGYHIDKFLRDGKFGDWTTANMAESAYAILLSTYTNWKRAEKTVSAKEYWEKYFAENPGKKPKHLFYYDGSPTVAIQEWQNRNNIGRADVSETEGKFLGFDDHLVIDMENDPRGNPGYDQLVQTANKIIAEHYGRKKA